MMTSGISGYNLTTYSDILSLQTLEGNGHVGNLKLCIEAAGD